MYVHDLLSKLMLNPLCCNPYRVIFTSCSEEPLSIWILRSLWNTAKECSSEILIFGLFSAENFFPRSLHRRHLFFICSNFFCVGVIPEKCDILFKLLKNIFNFESEAFWCYIHFSFFLWLNGRAFTCGNLMAVVRVQALGLRSILLICFNCTSARSNWRLLLVCLQGTSF